MPRVGIIGGGQLGKMLGQAAKSMSIGIEILEPAPNAPAAIVADYVINADFDDESAIRQLAKRCDVITYEREDINAEILKKLESEGHRIFPNPSILQLLQDKLLQKEFLVNNNIPTSPFEAADRPTAQQFETFGYPLVQKARCGGFDGRGVQVLSSKDTFSKALKAPSLIEKCVDIHTEIAVIVARSQNGDIQSYPVVEMTLDSNANILDLLIAPARISEEQQKEAQKIARHTIEALKLVGVLAVELFIDTTGHILVNEISGRPHNSGHYTIEACMTSQYEQHLRAILGYPLGSTALLCPAVMINLLGQGDSGKTRIIGLEKALAVSGASVHLYGKEQSSRGRKMGHVVILDKDIDSALEKAALIKDTLRITGGKDE